MEKIQPFLKSCYKNRFWIMCGLVAAASLLTWYLASSSIEAERERLAQQINSKKMAIDNVLRTSADIGEPNATVAAHPNDRTQKEMDARIKDAAKAALEAWKIRWDEQAAILKKNEQTRIEQDLEVPEHVRKALAKFNPPEALPFDEKDPISDNMRFTFKENVKKRMPFLADIVGTTWKYDENKEEDDSKADAASNRGRPNIGVGGGRGGGRGGGGAADAAQPVVINDLVNWDEKNQDLWNTKITQFTGFYGNKSSNNDPSTHQILALQQDLDILEAMLSIIAEVNDGYRANDLAPIEQIDHILVGQQAVSKLGKLSPITMEVSKAQKQASAVGQQAAGGISAVRPRTNMASQRNKYAVPGAGKEFDKRDSDSPFHGRYVDRNFKQLSEQEITNVVKSPQLTNQSYLAVAKRVPVRVAVKMDERKIGDFLAAAANSPFNFEVRQVRLNKHVPGEDADLSGTGGGQGGSGGGAPLLGRAGGGPGGGGGAKADDDPPAGGGGGPTGSPSSDGLTGEQRQSFDVKVEFVGIVKMYNPVNPGLFGIKEDTVQSSTGSAPAASGL